MACQASALPELMHTDVIHIILYIYLYIILKGLCSSTERELCLH